MDQRHVQPRRDAWGRGRFAGAAGTEDQDAAPRDLAWTPRKRSANRLTVRVIGPAHAGLVPRILIRLKAPRRRDGESTSSLGTMRRTYP
jgi:hypothetical protein